MAPSEKIYLFIIKPMIIIITAITSTIQKKAVCCEMTLHSSIKSSIYQGMRTFMPKKPPIAPGGIKRIETTENTVII
jgi:hypothetical protein